MRKTVEKFLALVMAVGMTLTVPTPAIAMDMNPSTDNQNTSSTQSSGSIDWILHLFNQEPEPKTVVSVSKPYLVKENDVVKAVKKTTYSDGSTEVTDAPEAKGLMELGSTMYYIKDGKVNSGYSGNLSAKRGTYKISKGKVTGVRFPVTKSSQMPNYPTGCEGSSMNGLLKWYGIKTNLDECINAIPRQNVVTRNGKRYGPSIYEKFAGNPRHGYTSSSPGYGAFSPVITKALNKVLKNHGSSYTAVKVTGTDVNGLYKYLREGHPLIVWCTYNMKTPTGKNSWYIPDGKGGWKYFSYPRPTHVVVLRGYDANNVYIMDSYRGTYKTYSRSAFNSKYKLLHKQAILLQKTK